LRDGLSSSGRPPSLSFRLVSIIAIVVVLLGLFAFSC
jgi:hypothetical protein